MSLRLLSGQSLLLSPPEGCCYVQLSLSVGFCRLVTTSLDGFEDLTLAILGERQAPWLRIPRQCSCRIEAITSAELELQFASTPQGCDELLADWLLALRHMRQPVSADSRLEALFRLLLLHFGQRTADGYRLPFQLSHGRLAELVGCTRSTVTRRISQLREEGILLLPAGQEVIMFSASFIEANDCSYC